MSTQKLNKISLVIIDTNVFLHSVITQYERTGVEASDLAEKILFFNAMYMLSGAYLENILPTSCDQVEIVFAMDVAPYWRSPKLENLGVVYKGKRYKNTQSHRAQIINPMKESLYNFLMSAYDLPLFSMYQDRESLSMPLLGFEADDIAAGLVLTQSQNYDKVYVLTNDHDWIPFTSFSNVIWLNFNESYPRVRGQSVALEWLKSCSESQKSKERKAFVWKDVRDLWRFKAWFGDTSDNIPGDKKDKTDGRYLQFIDLFNPTPGCECWMQPDFYEKFKSSKTKAHSIIKMSQIATINKGFPLCIEPFTVLDRVSSAW